MSPFSFGSAIQEKFAKAYLEQEPLPPPPPPQASYAFTHGSAKTSPRLPSEPSTGIPRAAARNTAEEQKRGPNVVCARRQQQERSGAFGSRLPPLQHPQSAAHQAEPSLSAPCERSSPRDVAMKPKKIDCQRIPKRSASLELQLHEVREQRIEFREECIQLARENREVTINPPPAPRAMKMAECIYSGQPIPKPIAKRRHRNRRPGRYRREQFRAVPGEDPNSEDEIEFVGMAPTPTLCYGQGSSELCSSCDTTFLPDSVFCRMCGAPRGSPDLGELVYQEGLEPYLDGIVENAQFHTHSSAEVASLCTPEIESLADVQDKLLPTDSVTASRLFQGGDAESSEALGQSLVTGLVSTACGMMEKTASDNWMRNTVVTINDSNADVMSTTFSSTNLGVSEQHKTAQLARRRPPELNLDPQRHPLGNNHHLDTRSSQQAEVLQSNPRSPRQAASRNPNLRHNGQTFHKKHTLGGQCLEEALPAPTLDELLAGSQAQLRTVLPVPRVGGSARGGKHPKLAYQPVDKHPQLRRLEEIDRRYPLTAR